MNSGGILSDIQQLGGYVHYNVCQRCGHTYDLKDPDCICTRVSARVSTRVVASPKPNQHFHHVLTGKMDNNPAYSRSYQQRALMVQDELIREYKRTAAEWPVCKACLREGKSGTVVVTRGWATTDTAWVTLHCDEKKG